MINQAVILAAGLSEEFGRPVGFLKIPEGTIIERILNLLEENGIKDILVIAGYESEYYEALAKERGFKIIKNPKYKWTGTMSSLAYAKDFVKEDFILIESDIVFEERALWEIIDSAFKNCMVVTTESGSGDEAFVDIREEKIFKMSKDKHQLNKIDGEMIGICKISHEVYGKMLEEFKLNKNPYLNYEYVLMDVSKDNPVGYVKVDDLIWGEIDHKEHYDNMVNYVFPKLKIKEKEVKEAILKGYIIEALNVKDEEIKDLKKLGGLTNRNYKFTMNGENYVLRAPGTGSNEIVNRKDEKYNSEQIAKSDIDSHIIYFNEYSGVKIAKFIENAETFTGESAKKEENMVLSANILKKLHTSGAKFKNTFDTFDKIEEYEALLKKVGGEFFEDYQDIKKKVFAFKELLEDLDSELVACHNDALAENFVKGSDRLYLIDWEYSGMNDAMWDLAAYSLECKFSKLDEELFLNIYFNGEPEEKYKKRILIYKICQDIFWSIWSAIKEAQGDDMGSYTIDRYNRGKKNLEVFYSL